MGRSLSWFDVCFHHGGRSNGVSEVPDYWNKHRAFKLRIKKYGFSNGRVWVSNNRKFIPLKMKPTHLDLVSFRKRWYRHSIPDWVTDGQRYGFVVGHYPQSQYRTIQWYKHNNNPDPIMDKELGKLTFNEANRMRIHWSAAWKAIGW